MSDKEKRILPRCESTYFPSVLKVLLVFMVLVLVVLLVCIGLLWNALFTSFISTYQNRVAGGLFIMVAIIAILGIIIGAVDHPTFSQVRAEIDNCVVRVPINGWAVVS